MLIDFLLLFSTKKLPPFCYLCWIVGHRSNTCSHWHLKDQGKPSPPPCLSPADQQGSAVKYAEDQP